MRGFWTNHRARLSKTKASSNYFWRLLENYSIRFGELLCYFLLLPNNFALSVSIMLHVRSGGCAWRSCVLSRAWGLRLALVTSFSPLARGYVYALGLGFKFSRAWSRWEIFPRSFDKNIFAGLSLISVGHGYHVKELLLLVGLWPKASFIVIASYSSDSFSHWVTQPNSAMSRMLHFYIAVILLLRWWES